MLYNVSRNEPFFDLQVFHDGGHEVGNTVGTAPCSLMRNDRHPSDALIGSSLEATGTEQLDSIQITSLMQYCQEILTI